MEIATKPVCEYGANCYRKNPNHFKEYTHPQDKVKEQKQKIDKKEPLPKKPKLDIVKEKVERIEVKKEPVKQNSKTPESAKKFKQTTLNFFKKDEIIKGPVALRRSPRKHNLENKDGSNEKEVKLSTSPKKHDIETKEKDTKKSPIIKKQRTPEKKKLPDKKVRSPEKPKVKVDYISDSDEEASEQPIKVKATHVTEKKLPQVKVKSPEKARTKIDYISDSDEETSAQSKKNDESEKITPVDVQKKKSPKKNESEKKTRTNVDYMSDSDKELKNDSKSATKSESNTSSQKSDKTDGKTIIEESDDEEDEKKAPAQYWVYIKKEPEKKEEDPGENKDTSSREGLIKNLFLVDMPQDFYSLFDFCESLDNAQPLKALQICGLKLVGPFDILAGNKQLIGKGSAVCHWRYYYDPPEFQTILSGEKGFHMGYWRDDPKEQPVFVASNNAEKGCLFKIESENIFGALNSYLNDYVKSCDPFTKSKIPKLQSSLQIWAEKNDITLDKMTEAMKKRQKKVVSKTLHRAGLVVPVEPKTELGYRPLIETEANLKKICKLIMDSSDKSERDVLWDNLQPLITAANIANDECDFGNGLELGIDLFCMGSPVFHDTIEHLLSTSYSLLNRNEFAEIIQKHLKNRRKGSNLSVV